MPFCRWRLAAAIWFISGTAWAQTDGATKGDTILPDVDVVGGTPLLGSGVDRDKVPAATHVLTHEDITRDGPANAVKALNENVGGVTVDDAASNPFQPNLLYHGFQASPLQGNAQGLAVYLNGVRFNQPFGDTVNWDLLPDIAIDRIDLVGSDPVFGLNALGGAVSVRLRNGFTYHGVEGDIYGGSFGRVTGEFQYGRQSGDTSSYVSTSATHMGGWRQFQSSDLYNFYGDIGWRSDKAEMHLDIVGADTNLNGPGASPVELIAADPAAQFTAPNLISNKYALVSLSGLVDVTDKTSIQGVVYYSYLQQRVRNGNVSDVAPCADGSGLLCVDPGIPATGRNGNAIPDFLNGGPYSQLDQQNTNTNGYGLSLQATHSSEVFGRPNRLIVGASFDGGSTMFSGNSAVGGLTPLDRAFVGPGIVIDQAGGPIAPVRVGITNSYYGLFFTDSQELLPGLSLNISGRFNAAVTDLGDQTGKALTGNHAYTRFNPGLGLTYKVAPGVSVYASYSEANRAPTPAELSCANAAAPCSLANFFVGDPDLKQVVAHTIEAGLRGQVTLSPNAKLTWNGAFFHTDLDDDILFVSSPIQGRAFFQNVGSTRRQGVDVGLRFSTGRLLAWIDYSHIDATFQSGFVEASPNNPAADANGNIFVRPGNRLPGIPANLLKLGTSYKVTGAWTVGATGIAASGQQLFGDEANLTPTTPAYFVLKVNTSYRLTDNIQLFGFVQNAFNKRYYTFGTFSPTSSIFIAQAPGATNPRAYSVAAPVAGYAGLRVTF